MSQHGSGGLSGGLAGSVEVGRPSQRAGKGREAWSYGIVSLPFPGLQEGLPTPPGLL